MMSISDTIEVKGARVHNLKNISVTIPKNKLVVFTGVSGSGKTSLAFDTIYAEGQRRYVQSLSSYARQFLGVMQKPDVDSITGLSPAISIDQKTVSHNPRSTVGTITELYDLLRLLFARVGHPHCPECGREIVTQTVPQIVAKLMQQIDSKAKTDKIARFFVLAPVVRDRKGEFTALFDRLLAQGYTTVRVDGQYYTLSKEKLGLVKTNKHTIDVVVDKLSQESGQLKNPSFRKDLSLRLTHAVEQALNLSDGLLVFVQLNDSRFSLTDHPKNTSEELYSEHYSCPVCNISLEEPEPRLFSFNSPQGACPVCTGLGSLLKIDLGLILNPHLSVLQGGIIPIAKMMLDGQGWYASKIRELAHRHHFSLTVPVAKLAKKHLDLILYGTGVKHLKVSFTNSHGDTHLHTTSFEGIIPNLERRFRETDSDYIRDEIGKYLSKETCPECLGSRLKKEALAVTIAGKSIFEVDQMAISDLEPWLNHLPTTVLSPKETEIASSILRELAYRLEFLISVGLGYLSSSRTATTLAGGEAQRIRLASQVGAGLSGVLYVLDEPTIGLHPRDNQRLIGTLRNLRDLGNSVIVVEHDQEMMESADLVYDFGPGAGAQGGTLVASGTVAELKANPRSLTGQYLAGKKTISPPSQLTIKGTPVLKLVAAREHNLKNITVTFPLGHFICVTGVSGSGKSTLVNETLYPALAKKLSAQFREKAGEHDAIEGWEAVDKILFIDQSPIGRTPRSNPATYSGAFNYIRDLFAQTAEARLRGWRSGRFSFNVKGGRCAMCEGAGEQKIEMQFLADVYVTCDACGGSRYNRETLEILYKDKTIKEVLDMSVGEAMQFFHHFPPLASRLQTLADVGLGYIKLGQGAPTVSGGEAQRLKLARELTKRNTGRTVYLLDEPTTGLHFEDLKKLLHVLRRLVSFGNTVIVIEHNLDVVKNADWVIDLGPEGGDGGGEVVAVGTPTNIARHPKSLTGRYLKPLLEVG